jgi:formylaminopyrimidine deformylase / aminopyrimidine aminohydrolase
MTAHPLVRNAGPLWAGATRSPFLDALASGSLAGDAFRRWLAQDYLFAKDLTAFQAVLVAKAPRDCHRPLIEGLSALDRELDWFETHAARMGVDLGVSPHPACRRYCDFLLRCAYPEPCPVLLAILFGVEASYLTAWSALKASGPYAEFIERWSSAGFAAYVAALGSLAEQHPHETAQERFNEVLVYERDFWQMSWEG